MGISREMAVAIVDVETKEVKGLGTENHIAKAGWEGGGISITCRWKAQKM